MTYRQVDKINIPTFQNELTDSIIGYTELLHEPNEALQYLINTIQNALAVHAPQKTKRVKSLNLPGWFTEDIKQAIKLRDKLKKIKQH